MGRTGQDRELLPSHDLVDWPKGAAAVTATTVLGYNLDNSIHEDIGKHSEINVTPKDWMHKKIFGQP